MKTTEEIRELAEASLPAFIRLIAPGRMLSGCHLDVCNWWEKEGHMSHQLLLFPRDHMKSALVAFRVAWYLTKDPTLRVLYISSTSNLAQKQLGFIKQIFESDIHRKYWPDHIIPDEGKREKWTNTEICLDHPLRKKEQVRDPSIFTGGLTTNLVGMHCDIAVLDDVVTNDNAYTNEGREKVRHQYSLLSSIEGAESLEWVVGTRYHPNDLYNDLMEMKKDVYDGNGELKGQESIYEIFERVVEDAGDGTGQFLWPREKRKDGRWFGFDRDILARKRGQYLNRLQFRAQYYNDPSDPDNVPVDSSKFQYYDHKYLTRMGGRWYYKEQRLNLFAAVDFAYTLKASSDYSAIVVVGVDPENNVYVLDIDRFRADRVSEYYEHILQMVSKWDFRKLRAEVTAAQSVIVNELKNNYIKPNGIALSIEEHKPNRYQGSKEERIQAVLEPRYDNLQVYHYRDGNCFLLEQELQSRNPAHDDIKDAFASALEIAVKPSVNHNRFPGQMQGGLDNVWHSRFGGRAF